MVTGNCGEPDFDFNGDGYNDFIVSDGGNGSVLIFLGNCVQPSVINHNNADVTITSLINEFGCSVSSAGDFNGDGFDDLIVGAYYSSDNGIGTGSAFIFFGSSNPSSTLNDTNANVKLIGENGGDEFGISVSCAGNLDGDDYDEVIVGAWKYNENIHSSPGRAYIFFGSNTPASQIDASNAEVIITGDDSGDCFGCSVSSAGNFNGDYGVVIGAYHDDDGGTDAGCAFIFAKQPWMQQHYDAQDAEVKLVGGSSDDEFGKSVSCAGNFDMDAYDDVIVGAHQDCDGGYYSGCAFIFLGSGSPASQINAASADVKLVGGDAYDKFGTCVSSAGDFNGDGYDDVIVGAPEDDDGRPGAGSAFIFFGRSVSAPPQVVINESNADIILFGEYSGDSFGSSVSNAGIYVIVGSPSTYYDDNAYIFIGLYNPPSNIDASDAYVELNGVGGNCVSGG